MTVPKRKPQIFIVDDHKLFRDGLKYILQESGEIEVVGEASDGKEFLELLQYIVPDLVLMDISMPGMNGVDASKIALEKYPDLKILVLSMFGDDAYYNSMIEIGVKGFILKDCDASELKEAIKSVLSGKNYFSQELLLKLIRDRNEAPTIKLSRREREVLEYICKGYSTMQISEALHISHRTVERHRASLLEKTNSSNSISLAIFAIKNNLIHLE
ncbi:MAG: response regulator transcription factor [Bacteroidales bacterium]|nr:response regulator transcription factor [Bacteroidales bacterium]